MKKTNSNIKKRINYFSLVAAMVVMLLASCRNGSKIEPVEETASVPDTTATAAANPDELLKGSGAPGKADDFKFGRFKYADENQFGDFIIVRSKESQIDSGAMTGLVIKFDLKWTSDTSYIMNFREMLDNPKNIQLPDPKGLVRKCWMSDIREDSYLETSTSTLGPDTIRTRINKLKK